jgi:hypothetical protein
MGQIGHPGRGLRLNRWPVLDGHETERFGTEVLEAVEQVLTGGEVEVARVAGPVAHVAVDPSSVCWTLSPSVSAVKK